MKTTDHFKKWIILSAFLIAAFSVLSFSNNKNKDLASKVDDVIRGYYIIVNPFDVTIDEKAKVRIEGQIKSLFDKNRITEIVSTVPGVQMIENNLIVMTTASNDEELKANLVRCVQSIPSILEQDRIDIEVTNGIVTLTGEVTYFREKLLLTSYLSQQKGVKEIKNNLTILPPKEPVLDEDIKKVIEELVEYRYAPDEDISFSVQKGVITANGHVQSLWSKNKIEEELLRIIGVKKVVNNIKIEG